MGFGNFCYICRSFKVQAITIHPSHHMTRITALPLLLIVALLSTLKLNAQIITHNGSVRAIEADTIVFLPWFDEELAPDVCLLDSANIVADSVIIEPIRPVTSIALAEYRKPIFDSWLYLDSLTAYPAKRGVEVAEAYEWIDDTDFAQLLLLQTRQNYFANNPEYVTYNAAWLPEQPDQLNSFADRSNTKLTMNRLEVDDRHKEVAGDMLDVERKNWIHDLNASVQFSQAYVSPNWYQGGNKSLIMLINAIYNVKLNQKFHPKILFESTIAYKLGTNSAPDDTVRSYNISEDLFQINSTFGYKALKHWYYSVNLQFKTQLLNAYRPNSTDVKSSLLSPGELNLGLGMTYNYENPKKTFVCNASIAPLSWQMTSCINSKIDETNYGIKPGHSFVNQYGSSAECKITWKLAYNITYNSRIFLFSDYSDFHGDWEHTLAFNINRFLTTQIFTHLRYDTATPRSDDPSWHKLQVKEVLSFGFAYRFSNI